MGTRRCEALRPPFRLGLEAWGAVGDAAPMPRRGTPAASTPRFTSLPSSPPPRANVRQDPFGLETPQNTAEQSFGTVAWPKRPWTSTHEGVGAGGRRRPTGPDSSRAFGFNHFLPKRGGRSSSEVFWVLLPPCHGCSPGAGETRTRQGVLWAGCSGSFPGRCSLLRDGMLHFLPQNPAFFPCTGSSPAATLPGKRQDQKTQQDDGETAIFPTIFQPFFSPLPHFWARAFLLEAPLPLEETSFW